MNKINATARLTAGTVVTAANGDIQQLWKRIAKKLVLEGSAKITDAENDSGGTDGMVSNDPIISIAPAEAAFIFNQLKKVPGSSVVIAAHGGKLSLSIHIEPED